jgi:hypothetical protein
VSLLAAYEKAHIIQPESPLGEERAAIGNLSTEIDIVRFNKSIRNELKRSRNVPAMRFLQSVDEIYDYLPGRRRSEFRFAHQNSDRVRIQVEDEDIVTLHRLVHIRIETQAVYRKPRTRRGYEILGEQYLGPIPLLRLIIGRKSTSRINQTLARQCFATFLISRYGLRTDMMRNDPLSHRRNQRGTLSRDLSQSAMRNRMVAVTVYRSENHPTRMRGHGMRPENLICVHLKIVVLKLYILRKKCLQYSTSN